MSLLLMRAAILAQGTPETGPPVDLGGTAWELDVTRRPAGYTLSDANRTAINTAGGTNYQRWVPTARAILPSDGRRYWEILCAPGGASAFDGFMGVVSQAQREEFNAGLNPITRGSIGWRGNGTLWSSDTATAFQRLSGLPPFGSGDVLMFVLDPAQARLWIGRNGLWHSDPLGGAPTWTAAPSPAFHPQVQGRNPGDGGTLRSLPSEFSYPVPPGVQPLAYADPDLRIHQAHAFIEFAWDRGLSIGTVEAWQAFGGAAHLTAGSAAVFLDHGGGAALTTADATLYIELDLS